MATGRQEPRVISVGRWPLDPNLEIATSRLHPVRAGVEIERGSRGQLRCVIGNPTHIPR
jgi:hypothetical protein